MKKYQYLYVFLFGAFNFLFTQEVFEGYTLFTPQIGLGGDATTYLIDNDYNVIQSWAHENGPASMPYLISGDEPGWENTLLIYPYRVNNPTMESGGVGGAVECQTWDGELVWEYVLSNSDYQHHHDVEPLPNGNVLMIAWEKKTAEEAYSMGREEINNPLNQLWSSVIFEIEPDGNGGAEVVWEWHLWDHLIQDSCPDCPNYGTISNHPELFNINIGDVGTASGPGGANADWIHLNAIDYHEEWGQIALSSRYQSEIFVIDHGTTTEEAASHSGGNYGKGGDFLYRWGNPQNYNRGHESDRIFSDQHSINWIPIGYPGENNFIVFNNYHEGVGPWGESAVLEFILPVGDYGNYSIEGGESFGPDNYIWSYEYGIFTAMQGGSFRLPNGNTLITDCDSAYILEITDEGNIVWEYEMEEPNAVIARAQKYALDYFDDDYVLMGDLNDDNILNILDLVILVNLILSNENSAMGDMNNDAVINILDAVILANIILNGEN